MPDPHATARSVYRAYLARVRDREALRAHADAVSRATSGAGMTPVMPLATMGPGGGPLRCDHCGKPMVLEGGKFHGRYADEAWAASPDPAWRSYIYGGMVIDIQTNGSLRVYHGYPDRPGHCCTLGDRAARAAQDAWTAPPERAAHRPLLKAFLEHEFPDQTPAERARLLSDIIVTMYSYDPGPGRNRPEAT